MEYKYDPILCMNIPVEKSKVKDASWKAWTLYIDGKWVKSFTSVMAPIKEAQKFMKENHPGKVGKLVRNTGSTSGYSISGSEYKDEAPVKGKRAVDANKKEGYVIHSAQINGNKIVLTIEDLLYSPGEKERMSFTKEEAKKLKNDPWTSWKGSTKSMLEKFISSSKDAKAIVKAIKACDVKYTTVEYYDHAGKKHTSYKESEEEAKKWIDSGKFPQTVIYDVKINGKLYKKQIRT